ncbi:MAG TPA: sensor histidine kinase [Polyangia bacterium]|nr:sensor histidine kinase [Polyangia bacterium]
MNDDAGSVRGRLGRIIEQRSEEIERRWLERIQQDVVKQPGVELTLLRDGMPHYLLELTKLLGNGVDPLDDRAESAWTRVARDHGITRVRIGFDISQLVHEFMVLRRTIQEVVREEDASLPSADVLADVLEAAIAVAVQAYVEARDFESRRAQAANVGFLTHELRHPLAAVSLSATRLRRHAVPEQEHALEILERGVRRLSELIDGVLLTEKLEAGEITSAPKATTVGQLMESIEALRGAAEQKGLRFRTAYDPDVALSVDVDLTRSVLQNLADNAVKYTDQGEVEISVTEAGDEVVVDFRDTCKGLSPEELQTIFEPFKRGRTEKTGTGLGLAIARRAVEAQGGSIHAESPGPSGCHFCVRLPRYPLRDSATAPAPAP